MKVLLWTVEQRLISLCSFNGSCKEKEEEKKTFKSAEFSSVFYEII